VKTYSDPSYIFSGDFKAPKPLISTSHGQGFTELKMTVLVFGGGMHFTQCRSIIVFRVFSQQQQQQQ